MFLYKALFVMLEAVKSSPVQLAELLRTSPAQGFLCIDGRQLEQKKVSRLAPDLASASTTSGGSAGSGIGLPAQTRKLAQQLLPVSDRELLAERDPHLRRLLRGVPDDAPPQLGRTCHIKLYEEMLRAAQCKDTSLTGRLRSGFPIVDRIEESQQWPAFAKPQDPVPVQEALRRAWEFKRKIFQRCAAVPVNDNLRAIWKSTIEDVEEGYSVGPLADEAEVSAFIGSEEWIPTQRFEVVQKSKVRGCDSATSNLVNRTAVITEKLQLPSTLSGRQRLQGWVLDERKAYRQIPVKVDHRRFTVICLKDPGDHKPKYFVMIGHSFGLVSAVYKYNHRSAAINDIFEEIFSMISFNFYDDKYGFETCATAPSARKVAEEIHFRLGAQFEAKKLQLSLSPVILGVTYNLDSMVLEIEKERKEELVETIDSILHAGTLDPGSAGKLKGKLMFGSSQLWGKAGRAFFRPLSERQYLKDLTEDRTRLTEPLIKVPEEVRRGDLHGGFTPDLRKKERGLDRVGAVMFDRRDDHPRQFSAVIPEKVVRKWLFRKTQIVPMEMIATVLAIETFKDHLRGKDVLLLIDSEAVEASLVKGYSSKQDLCEIIELFWDLALELRRISLSIESLRIRIQWTGPLGISCLSAKPWVLGLGWAAGRYPFGKIGDLLF
ncbi:unnamed protein product [Symbiodinium pilosum]|uniref:Uncharacterized protein n=1 Tax=Symbiodinium pilosum TaxID=2952 RepID=A0A812TFC8_SYMPI|nr:unnamed protein product [Symbiodinium pilosum]